MEGKWILYCRIIYLTLTLFGGILYINDENSYEKCKEKSYNSFVKNNCIRLVVCILFLSTDILLLYINKI